MHRSFLLKSATFAAISCALALGCSDGEGKLYPVTGKVTYQSAPAAGATVVFHPVNNDKIDAVRPSGTVAEDGTYILSCPGPVTGAPAGEYEVAIIWDQAPAAAKGKMLKMSGEAKETKDKLEGKFANPKSSGLRATVKPESNAVPAFELK